MTQTRASRRAQLFPAPFEALAYQNLAVNPRHVLSQANGANVVSVAAPATAYVTDGHILAAAGASFTLTGQQVAAPFATRPDIENGLRVGVSVAKGSPASGDAALIAVPIEGLRSRRLLWGTANGKSLALGVMMLSTASGAFYVNVTNASTTRSYFQKVALVANQETFVPLAFPPCLDGSWASDNSLGLMLRIVLAAGSAVQGAANAWQTSNLVAASDQANFLASTANALTISDLVLLPMAEAAADATQLFPAERLPLFQRHFDDELRLCQRYYEKSYNVGDLPGTANVGGPWFGVAINVLDFYDYGRLQFSVRKRTTPTITGYSYSGTQGAFYDVNLGNLNGNAGFSYVSETGLHIYCNNSALASGHVSILHWIADARL